jgi:hypothetical protein
MAITIVNNNHHHCECMVFDKAKVEEEVKAERTGLKV